MRTDTATLGSWTGVYGAQGYALVNDATSLPAYAQVTVAGPTPYTWSGASSDLRALHRAAGGWRLAATWYQLQAFSVTVRLTDGQSHRIALYAVDWDRVGRQQRLDVRDAVTGTLLDTRTLSAFGGGQIPRLAGDRARDHHPDEAGRAECHSEWPLHRLDPVHICPR